jgi:hypothetical protein
MISRSRFIVKDLKDAITQNEWLLGSSDQSPSVYPHRRPSSNKACRLHQRVA